jgi:hypothetical protein
MTIKIINHLMMVFSKKPKEEISIKVNNKNNIRLMLIIK